MIRLIPIRVFSKRYLKRRGIFPFLVEIESHEYELLREYFESIKDWLGIGIVVREPFGENVLSRCEFAGAAEGRVGGHIRFGAQEIQERLVTCSHVVSQQCIHSVYRSDLKAETIEPDVALLIPNGKCFGRKFELSSVDPVKTCDSSLILAGGLQCLPGGKGRGVIFAIGMWAEYSGRVHKFPHFQIQPRVKIWFDLVKWPPWRRYFSRPGESGSWVVTGKSWLGLLVGANDFHRLSFAAISGPLLGFLLRVMTQKPPAKCYVRSTQNDD
jgi:hypothetical protein